MQTPTPEELERENAQLRERLAALSRLLQDEIATKASLEGALYLQGSNYLELVGRAPFAIARVRNDGTYVDVNHRLMDWLGGTEADYIGKVIGSAEEPPAWTRTLLWFLQERSLRAKTFELDLSSGAALGHLTVELWRRGTDAGFCLLATDRTQERRAQDAQRRSDAERAELVELLGAAMRDPLTGLVAMTSVLEATDLDEEQRSLLRAIEESGTGALSIVESVLERARR